MTIQNQSVRRLNYNTLENKRKMKTRRNSGKKKKKTKLKEKKKDADRQVIIKQEQ